MASRTPIAASEVRFRSLFENTPEIILYQDRTGTILDANPAFLALVELPKELVLGRYYHEFLPPEVQHVFLEKLREAFAGKTVRFDMPTSQGASETRHWDVVKVPLWEHDQVVGVHMIARDITEKTKNQQEIFVQNQDLQQFTYIVSHNLRSPLANALGLVELLRTETPDSPYYAQTHAHLQQNLLQLDQVLRDMNTILTIRDKQTLDAPEAVPLAEAVQQVVHGLAEVVQQAGGTVEVHIPAGTCVRANRAYLHSIFLNLLTNAIKYRAVDRALRVRITTRPKGDAGQCVVVADNGSGFDLERAGADVFRLYKRFHPNHPGRGLGLYLVKSHVESMGGHITVQSRVDEGTRFSIFLP
jgi:PAS domain S-box-containing protein